MGGQDQPPTLGQDIAQGRQGGDDPGIVGDFPVLVEGDVEVDPAENPFSLQVEVFDGDLVEHLGASENQVIRDGARGPRPDA